GAVRAEGAAAAARHQQRGAAAGLRERAAGRGHLPGLRPRRLVRLRRARGHAARGNPAHEPGARSRAPRSCARAATEGFRRLHRRRGHAGVHRRVLPRRARALGQDRPRDRHPAGMKPLEVTVRMRDGVDIALALYKPAGESPFPVLLGASPYRYDNNALPASPQFLWRETGPVDFYVERGYVYASMDARGCGKSGGEFRFLHPDEQQDLREVIQWLGAQPWSNGSVGGIGQSFFCMYQWWMGILKPPALKCLGAFDGLADPYRASVYQGGILGDFFGSYWWNQNRLINRNPAN